MDDFLGRLIANGIAKRVKDARERAAPGSDLRPVAGSPATTDGRQRPPQTPGQRPAQTAGQPPPSAPKRAGAPQVARPVPRGAPSAPASGIEAADPFARTATVTATAAPSEATLLSAFANRDNLLAGIVLSETLLPPLALRPERER